MQPDLAEAHNNLGNLLAGRKVYAEAAYHFEQAIASDPELRRRPPQLWCRAGADAAYAKAVVELETVVRLAPELALAHLDLADVLAAMGRIEEAARESRCGAAATMRRYVRPRWQACVP